MKKKVITIIISLAGLLSFTGYANIISVNFDNTLAAIDTNVFTGVVSDTSWDDQVIGTATFSTDFFENLDGTTLDLNVLSTASGRIANDVDWDNWAQEAGYRIKAGNLYQAQLEQIPYAEYKIIAYIGNFGSPQEVRLRLGTDGGYKYISASALSVKPSLVESTDIDNSDGIDAGSYVVFGTDEAPLTGSTQLLQIGGLTGTTIFGGFQVVAVVPEPVSIGLFGGGCGLLLLTRRVAGRKL